MIGPAIAQRARITLAAGRQTAQSRMREAGPMEKVRFVGLDVHKESIAIAVADGDGSAPETVATVPNDTSALLKRLKKLAVGGKVKCCYSTSNLWNGRAEPAQFDPGVCGGEAPVDLAVGS